MTDLVTWLRGCLDHDQKVAEAATPGPWRSTVLDEWDDPEPAVRDQDGTLVIGADLHVLVRADADHAALHDPARVLRQVKAYREILDRHSDPTHHCPEPYDSEGRSVLRNHVADDGTVGIEEVWLPQYCGDLRSLASVFSDRPGYSEAVAA